MFCPSLRDLLLRAIYSLLDTVGTTAGLTAHCVFSLHLKVPVLQRCDRNQLLILALCFQQPFVTVAIFPRDKIGLLSWLPSGLLGIGVAASVPPDMGVSS